MDKMSMKEALELPGVREMLTKVMKSILFPRKSPVFLSNTRVRMTEQEIINKASYVDPRLNDSYIGQDTNNEVTKNKRLYKYEGLDSNSVLPSNPRRTGKRESVDIINTCYHIMYNLSPMALSIASINLVSDYSRGESIVKHLERFEKHLQYSQSFVNLFPYPHLDTPVEITPMEKLISELLKKYKSGEPIASVLDKLEEEAKKPVKFVEDKL